MTDLDINARRHLLELPRLPPYRLEGNELGPDGAKALAPGLTANASLTKLDVRYNSSMGEEGKAALRKAVEGRSGFELIF